MQPCVKSHRSGTVCTWRQLFPLANTILASQIRNSSRVARTRTHYSSIKWPDKRRFPQNLGPELEIDAIQQVVESRHC